MADDIMRFSAKFWPGIKAGLLKKLVAELDVPFFIRSREEHILELEGDFRLNRPARLGEHRTSLRRG
jgi:hypothetical protein